MPHKDPEKRRAYDKAYRQTPERMAYDRARYQTPERRAYDKAHRQTPERKAYIKAYYQRLACCRNIFSIIAFNTAIEKGRVAV